MRLRPRNCLFALIANLAATILVSAGCGPGAPAEAPPQPQGSSKPKPRAALKLPARVIPAQHGAAQLLGRIGDKNLYSVNGERWLVDAAGKTERERAPLGDRLEGVFPYAQAGLAAIGWNAQHAYSFADVLGAPKMTVETNTPFTHVRPGPGAALLFTLFSATAVDLSTGLERGRFFPEFPVRDAVFVDERRGAVATAVGGIGTTTDGGKTWVPVRHKASMSPTLDLVLEGGGLRLREIYTNRIAKVDIDHAEIDDWEEAHPAAPRTPTPIEAWISTFGNPIPSAVRNGIDAGAGTGVVAWGENVARVDLATGLFTETAAFAGTSGECRGAMAGTDAYFVCSANGKRGLAEQLWRARTDGKLEMEKMSGATFGGPGSADVSGSGAGGLLVFQGCGDKWGSYCARQPNGTFEQVEPEMVPYPEAVAPLADGRVISVGVRAEPTGPLLELVASSARERRVLADVSFDDRVSVSVTRPEEGADGIVRFLVKEERAGKEDVYPYLYAYKRGSHGFRKTALPDGAQASFADGVLITVAKDRSKIQVSHDGGATFRDLDMPAGASTAFSSVTRLGLVSASHTRVGWEPLPEAETPPAQAPTMRIKAQAPVAKEALELSCTTSGPGKTGTLLPRYDGDLTVDFGVKAASKGVRREAFSSSSFVLDPKVLLLVEGKELPPGSAPAHVQANRWSVHWIDPTESGAKVRSVSAKAPYPDMRVPVRGVWARGGKVFFTVEVGEKKVLVRGKGSGFETAEVHPSLWPVAGEPQSFSADGSVIAYLAGGVLVVWKTGEAPKPIGVMNQRAGAMLGAPTKDGVPVFAEVEGQSYYRVFPLPADKLSGAPEEQIVRASWDGWTRSMTLLGGRGSVAFCDAKPAGNSFHATASAPTLWVRFEIDSSRGKSTGTVRYDAVTDGQSLCIEGLTAQIPNGIAIEVKAGGTTKTVEGLDVLRVAAKGRKGELTRSGRLDKVPLHAMTCAATPAAK